MSARGKQELMGFRSRRVAAFKKRYVNKITKMSHKVLMSLNNFFSALNSLIELAELEVKHAKAQYEFLRQSVIALRELA